MLVDKTIPAVIDQRAIPALSGIKKIDLHMRINPKPPNMKHVYILLAKCDSYIGADKSIEFTLKVNSTERKNNDYDEDHNENKEIDYEIPPEEDYQSNPKWYYLWNETFWEFLLTLVLLYFIYLVIASTSVGNKYVVPYVNWFYDMIILPIISFLNNNLYKILHPLLNQIKIYSGFDIEQSWNNYYHYNATNNSANFNEDDMFNDE